MSTDRKVDLLLILLEVECPLLVRLGLWDLGVFRKFFFEIVVVDTICEWTILNTSIIINGLNTSPSDTVWNKNKYLYNFLMNFTNYIKWIKL